MKRRSFIQGALALIGAAVAAKAMPQVTAGEVPIPGHPSYTGRFYYTNQFHVGETGPEMMLVSHSAQFYDSGGNPVGGPTQIRIP